MHTRPRGRCSCCHFLSPGVQVFTWRDVSGSSRPHSSLLHQREPRSLPAQRLPLRRPAGCTLWFEHTLSTLPVCFARSSSSLRSSVLSLSRLCPQQRKANHCQCGWFQEEKDWQWKQATDYLSAVTELNYMTQIVIMLYEDNDKVGRQSAAELQVVPPPEFCLLHVFVLCSGADLRGALPRGASLQPGGQRLRGRGERSPGLRLPPGFL